MITQLKKYGPVNSIVLSRSAGSDNVYLSDEISIEENGLCEIKIVDNQIMNFNDRSTYLPDILEALDGLEYYINDFSSTGILYYDICDRYNVHIQDSTYSCILFNDEINVTTGLEEFIHTDMPEQGETDYEKADKTDIRINETYLIVDKQNQTIQSVVSSVGEQNNKISQITQTVDQINSKISDIADITTSAESSYAVVNLSRVNQSEPIAINVHPIVENISYLYPNTNLYPSSTTYLKIRTIRFIRTYEEEGVTKTQNIDYELPDDLLWYDAETYDEFYLGYDTQICQVTKRCGYNADGTVYKLQQEQVNTYTYPEILLGDGDYEIKLLSYTSGYIYVQLMAQNIYTDQFAVKAEVRTQINQTAQEILLEAAATYETKQDATNQYSTLRVNINGISTEVGKKVGNTEIISKINQSPEAITINANKISLEGKTINLTSDNVVIQSTNFSVDKNGNITANSGHIGMWTIQDGKIMAGDGGAVKVAAMQAPSENSYWVFAAGGSTHNSYGDCPFRVSKNGELFATSANISGTITATSGTFQNCTITNSCTVPASTVSGTLSTNTIPNLSASKITSGTMSAGRISGGTMTGVTMSGGRVVGSDVSGLSVSGDVITVANEYSHYAIGSQTGKSFKLIVQHEGKYWRRLTFTGGILTKIEESW